MRAFTSRAFTSSALASLLLACALTPLRAIAQQPPAIPGPFIVEQTYWIKPGREQQFIGLFEKNRASLLRAKMKEGRIVWVRLVKPRFNADNEQWDLKVTIAWRDADSAIEPAAQSKAQLTTEQQIIEELIVERTEVPVQEWTVSTTGN